MFNSAQIQFYNDNLLLQNQIDFLVGKKINASSLNSHTSAKERNAILKDLMSKSPKIKLLYVTPEMGAQQHFQVCYLQVILHVIVILMFTTIEIFFCRT